MTAVNRPDFRFSHPLRWADEGASASVLHAQGLPHLEAAFALYWRSMAMPWDEVAAVLGGHFQVLQASWMHHASAQTGDALVLRWRCEQVADDAVTWAGAMCRGDALLLSAQLTQVFVDPVSLQRLPLPQPLRQMWQAHAQGQEMVQLHTGTWAQWGAMARSLRTEVFVHEQRVPEQEEWDDKDADALHCVVVNHLDMPLATGRLLQEAPGVARIGRMAVKKSMRGSDLGRRVLHALMAQARARSDQQAVLSAQCTAVGFYERSGFAVQGQVYQEAGIAHVDMVRSLAD